MRASTLHDRTLGCTRSDLVKLFERLSPPDSWVHFNCSYILFSCRMWLLVPEEAYPCIGFQSIRGWCVACMPMTLVSPCSPIFETPKLSSHNAFDFSHIRITRNMLLKGRWRSFLCPDKTIRSKVRCKIKSWRSLRVEKRRVSILWSMTADPGFPPSICGSCQVKATQRTQKFENWANRVILMALSLPEDPVAQQCECRQLFSSVLM